MNKEGLTPMDFEPLSREEIIAVIEGRSAARRVPILLHIWTSAEAFGERQEAARAILDRYPLDVQIVSVRIPDVYRAPEDDPEYRWVNYDDPDPDRQGGLDERAAITDWAQLDGVLANFPSPRYPGLLPDKPAPDGRYRLGHFWYCLFERHWQLRGMTHALMDYYTDPGSVHRLFRAVTDFYLALMERAKAELDLDGIFTSDDLGTQNSPFFSREIFDEFYRPYYKELFDKAHSLGMHFWLHACGCIEEFLPTFVELGLDVIHPIQKYTMDERRIAERFGQDLCIWAGFDVQQTIPYGSPEDVRREVRFMMDTYARPEGRFMFTAGNGITGDCPLASLEALFAEAFEYGTLVQRRLGQTSG